jgi:hypothetical protein
MLQHCYHSIHRPTALLLQQGSLLRLDGFDEAAFWRRRSHHDILVGARQDAHKRRRKCEGPVQKDKRREAGM